MKNKNRTGILTALLAVLSIQGVEFKKKIGIITALAVLVSLTGIAAANPFDISYHLASPLEETDAGSPIMIDQGASTVLSLHVEHFLPASLPGTYPLTVSVVCASSNPGCHPSDIITSITAPASFAVGSPEPTEGFFIVNKLTVQWTGSNDPDGTLYLLGVNAGPGGPQGEFASASRLIMGHKPSCNDPGQPPCEKGGEWWETEWFDVLPRQYTELNLPEDGQLYHVTTRLQAPEGNYTLYNEKTRGVINGWTDDRLKFWHDPKNNPEDLYVNRFAVSNEAIVTTLRVHGVFGEGPGDLSITDPETKLKPEDAPYTNPTAPFFPQADQAPRKDFVTFNPIFMDHNDADWDNNQVRDDVYSKIFINDPNSQTPHEKIMKRMWYEKNWFKDEDKDGVWDKVCCDELGQFPREWNNPELYHNGGDVYGPTISQEFTYMFLDDNKQPTLVPRGSRFYLPMASNETNNGLDSFDANGDNIPDLVQVESEATLNLDIDNHNGKRKMDVDGREVSADESVVLMLVDGTQSGIDVTLPNKSQVQFFDHKVVFSGTTRIGGEDAAKLDIYSQEGTSPNGVMRSSVNLKSGEIAYFSRGLVNTGEAVQGPFFVKVTGVARDGSETATIQVGRFFGNLAANIGANDYWNQKAFIVDRVFYNVAAIKAVDNTFKYISIRQDLPKVDIKLYGIELRRWSPGTPLAEMPQFNMNHDILEDVLDTQTFGVMGLQKPRPALNIIWVQEKIEPRFDGWLQEIYWETGLNEYWAMERFNIFPKQYTELVLPPEDKYLVTTGFWAPEAQFKLINETNKLVRSWQNDRFKFWFDASNSDGLFVNNGNLKVYGYFGEGPGDLEITDPESNNLKPEDAPYTDPIAPFYPQADQAPRKDFVTFDPVFMDHNDPDWNNDRIRDDVYSRIFINDANSQTPHEKIMKRMWYEKNWFKDEDKDGVWDKVGSAEWNNPELNHNGGDVYAPTISQEFTYMFLNDDIQPILAPRGSRFYVPMASYQRDNGLDSFDANGDDVPDLVQVESEATLGLNIDNHGTMRNMDEDGREVSADESVVLMLADSHSGIDVTLATNDEVQFFDHKVEFNGTTRIGGVDAAKLDIYSTEGTSPGVMKSSVNLKSGEIAYFSRGLVNTGQAVQGPFFVKVTAVARDGSQTATIQVGRLFGHLAANIGDNDYWNQKAFIVDRVFYNIAAIKAHKDNTFKYITIRQELPKKDIKVYGIELRRWDTNTPLAEMPQFNINHAVVQDVRNTAPIQNILGRLMDVPALEITYVREDKEPRLLGQLKEIYNQTGASITPPPTCKGDITGDGLINRDDFALFATAYNSATGDARYNAKADMNSNGLINRDDFALFASVYGTSCRV